MSSEQQIREHFKSQAAICQRMGSPFTASLCDLVSEHVTPTTSVGRRVLGWMGDADPIADALALRLAGALHALVLSGKDIALASIYPPTVAIVPVSVQAWHIIEAAFENHEVQIHHWLDSPPQTNEVARAGMIMPVIAQVAERFGGPVALYEIGASSGLTLQQMKFRFRYGDILVGDHASPVELIPDVRGQPPVSGCLPEVVSRRGCDLNPLDPTDGDGALRLRSYVWPDQADRHARLLGAIDLYKVDPPDIVQTDASDFVCVELANRPRSVLSVFYHTVVWQYLADTTRRSIAEALREAGAKASQETPLCLVGMEGHGRSSHTVIELTTWFGDPDTDGRKETVALADYHGRWIDWKKPVRPQ